MRCKRIALNGSGGSTPSTCTNFWGYGAKSQTRRRPRVSHGEEGGFRSRQLGETMTSCM